MRSGGGNKYKGLAASLLGAAVAGSPKLTPEASAYIDPEGFESMNDLGPVQDSTGNVMTKAPARPPTQMYKKPSFLQRAFAPEYASDVNSANMGAEGSVFENTAKEYFEERASSRLLNERAARYSEAHGVPLEEARQMVIKMGTVADQTGTARGGADVAEATLRELNTNADIGVFDRDIRGKTTMGNNLAAQFTAANAADRAYTILPLQLNADLRDLEKGARFAPKQEEFERLNLDESIKSVPDLWQGRRFQALNPDASMGGRFNLGGEQGVHIPNPSLGSSGGGLADFFRQSGQPMVDPNGVLSREDLTPEEQAELDRRFPRNKVSLDNPLR